MVAICRLIYNLLAVYTFQVQHVKWSYSSVKIIKNYTLQQYNLFQLYYTESTLCTNEQNSEKDSIVLQINTVVNVGKYITSQDCVCAWYMSNFTSNIMLE